MAKWRVVTVYRPEASHDGQVSFQWMTSWWAHTYFFAAQKNRSQALRTDELTLILWKLYQQYTSGGDFSTDIVESRSPQVFFRRPINVIQKFKKCMLNGRRQPAIPEQNCMNMYGDQLEARLSYCSLPRGGRVDRADSHVFVNSQFELGSLVATFISWRGFTVSLCPSFARSVLRTYSLSLKFVSCRLDIPVHVYGEIHYGHEKCQYELESDCFISTLTPFFFLDGPGRFEAPE